MLASVALVLDIAASLAVIGGVIYGAKKIREITLVVSIGRRSANRQQVKIEGDHNHVALRGDEEVRLTRRSISDTSGRSSGSTR